MGQSYATAVKTIIQFVVIVPFDRSHQTTFTRRLKSCKISACWPMTHVFTWLLRSVCCYPSSVSTSLTRMVPTTDSTDHPRIIICLVNVGLLLLVVGGAAPGASVADVMTDTRAYTWFTRWSVAPTPLNLTFFYAGLCPLACLLL